MIVDKDPDNKPSFSFKVTSKVSSNVKAVKSKQFHQNKNENEEEDKDYILAAEGRELKSTKPSKDKGKLVIPMIKKNNWRVENENESIKIEDKEAVNELLKELEAGGEEENVSIQPILMQNRLPRKTDDETTDEMHDISVRPEQSSMEDYDSIPITAFGCAMLRGMGWSEGKPIGLNNTGLCEPIEYIPRHKGLGLGAEKRNISDNKQRKRKLGEDKLKQKNNSPIVDKDGRVRHIRHLGEETTEAPKGYFPGSNVQILKGVHKNLYGKIVSVDEDTARISVKLALSGEIIQISQYNTNLVDTEEYKKYAKRAPNDKKENMESSNKHSKKERLHEEENNRDSEYISSHCWMMPNIRVRIISKTYKDGRYYNKKVKLLDVIGRNVCCCKTDEKKLLEDVRQEYIETIIPKNQGDYVLIVNGKYKGKIAKLLERHKSECEAVVQLTSNKHVTTVSYDDLSEYVGELPEDEFL